MTRACRRHNKRDVVASGVVALDRLVEVCLGVRLEKDPEIRLCVWSASTLTPKQLAYAALDAEYSLRVFFYLLPLDNLTLRLGRDDAIVGVAVDVVPSHGSVAVMATRAACATIAELEEAQWPTPRGCTPRSLSKSATRQLVTVTEVLAPSMIVPGVKNSEGQRLTFGDLGAPPFSVMLPIAMLAPSSARRQATPAAARASAGAALGAAPDAAAAAPPGAAAAAAPGAAAAPAPGAADAAAPGAAPMLVDDDAELLERAAQAAEATHAATAARASVSVGDDDDAAPGYTGGGHHDGDHDGDAAELDLGDVRAARAAAAAAAAAIHGGTTAKVATPLDAPPLSPIRDVFSSVIGDNFHMMDRPKVPVHHSSKKGYFVALQEAM